MAAANSKQMKSISLLEIRRVKTVLIFSFACCFVLTLGYACIRYGEITKVCEEQDLSKTSNLNPFQIVEVFYHFLFWCGVQQTNVDLIKETSVLCSESWIYIIYIIFTEKFPEDISNFLNNLTGAFVNQFNFVSLFAKRVIEKITAYLPLPEYTSFNNFALLVMAALILLILTILWKLILVQKKSSSESIVNDHLYEGHNRHFMPSTTKSYKSQQLTPMASNYVGSRQEIIISKAIPSYPHYFSYACFMQWMFLLVTTASILSIPWEFLRLYQKSVASRAARVMKGLPPHCIQTSMSWFENIQFLLRWHFSWSHDHDVCQDYYYASLVDPVWEVNPLLVLSSVFTRGILHPIEVVSSSLGRSVRAFFSEIPLQWQPIIMLIAVVMGMVLLLMTCRYRLSIPLFLRFEPKTPVTSPSERPKSRRDRFYKSDASSDKGNVSLKWDDDYSVNVPDKFSDNGIISREDRGLSLNGYGISRKLTSSPLQTDSNLRNQKNSNSELYSMGKKKLDDRYSVNGISSRNSLLSDRENKKKLKSCEKDFETVGSNTSDGSSKKSRYSKRK